MEQNLRSAQAAVQEQSSQLQAAFARETHLEQQVTALTGIVNSTCEICSQALLCVTSAVGNAACVPAGERFLYCRQLSRCLLLRTVVQTMQDSACLLSMKTSMSMFWTAYTGHPQQVPMSEPLPTSQHKGKSTGLA